MNHADLVAAIEAGVEDLGQALPPEGPERLARLLEELHRWSARMNLTAIRRLPDMVTGHVLDSLAVRPWLEGNRIIDIGTGAGFPGLPLAIAEPARDFELLDSNARKIGFVQHIAGLLGLDNVTPVRSRAEDYAPGRRFGTVLARAVTSTAALAALGEHLLDEGGVLLALKGRYPNEELEALPGDWTYQVTELDVPGLESHERHLVSLRRVKR